MAWEVNKVLILEIHLSVSLDFLTLPKSSQKTSDLLISGKQMTRNTILETIHGTLWKYLAKLFCL